MLPQAWRAMYERLPKELRVSYGVGGLLKSIFAGQFSK